jgi:hypothetical protein
VVPIAPIRNCSGTTPEHVRRLDDDGVDACAQAGVEQRRSTASRTRPAMLTSAPGAVPSLDSYDATDASRPPPLAPEHEQYVLLQAASLGRRAMARRAFGTAWAPAVPLNCLKASPRRMSPVT